MKISAALLVILSGWICAPNVIPDFFYRVDEPTWILVCGFMILALLVALTVAFALAGNIRLDARELVVSTPTGYASIPYRAIESIRRSRRGGSPKSQHLQIVFRVGDHPRILRVRPANMERLAMDLRDRCPHLSSSSGTSLLKQPRYARLLEGL